MKGVSPGEPGLTQAAGTQVAAPRHPPMRYTRSTPVDKLMENSVRVALASVVFLLSLGALATEAQQVPEYQVKAELLERFTRFIEWPASADNSKFVIGVIGMNPFGPYLEGIASTRKIKGRRVEIQYLRDPAAIGRCHLLFIAASEKASIEEILSRTRTKPILTVGDSTGFADAGVLINFYVAGNTVRFEINESAMGRSGLRASSKLLKLARVIDAERDGGQ